MSTTDEFAAVLPTLGQPDHVRPVPPERIEAYRGRLPDGLLRFWQEVGWCSFLNGYIWVCDPGDFAPILARVLEGDPEFRAPDYDVFLHNSFGDMWGWNPRTKLMDLDLPSADPTFMLQGPEKLRDAATGETWTDDEDVANKILRAKDSLAFLHQSGTEDFVPALEKLEPLAQGQIYAYVPAFALGGSGGVDSIRRVQAREHMLFVADLAEVTYQHYFYDPNDRDNPMGRFENVRPIGRRRTR